MKVTSSKDTDPTQKLALGGIQAASQYLRQMWGQDGLSGLREISGSPALW